MADREQVIAWLINNISAKLDIPKEKISEKSRFQEDLGVDSINQSLVAIDVDDEFGVDIPNDRQPKTLGEVATIIIEEIEKLGL